MTGAVLGDNIGFLLGRVFGLRLLHRFGHYVRIGGPRIRLGQFLFLRHGGKIVFFGRFVAVLRALAAFVAGANQMGWSRFLVANAAGAIVWSSLYGVGAFYLGKRIDALKGPLGLGILVAVLVSAVVCCVLVRRNEARLQSRADKLLLVQSGR